MWSWISSLWRKPSVTLVRSANPVGPLLLPILGFADFPEELEDYREVAILLSQRIDLLAEVSEDTIALDELRDQIKLLQEDRDLILKDAAERHSRYSAATMLACMVDAKG